MSKYSNELKLASSTDIYICKFNVLEFKKCTRKIEIADGKYWTITIKLSVNKI